MPWITPKTNWRKDDWFQIADWERINGNIAYIAEYARPIYGTIYLADMLLNPVVKDGPDTRDYPFVWWCNAVEDNLTLLGKTIVNLNTFPGHVTQKENEPFWDYIDLNRIESFTLRLYELLQFEYQSGEFTDTLAFTLDGGYFATVLQGGNTDG